MSKVVSLQTAICQVPNLSMINNSPAVKTHFCVAIQLRWTAKWRNTLTILSQPADTMIGLLEFGENRTQDTHSVCPSSCLNKCKLKTLSYWGWNPSTLFWQSKLLMDQIILPSLLQIFLNFEAHDSRCNRRVHCLGRHYLNNGWVNFAPLGECAVQ